MKRWEFVPIEDNLHWELDFNQLDSLISPKTKMLVVNFPHNPTGYLPTQDQLNELGSIVEQHDLILFCDEMYFGLVHSGTPSISSAADVTRNAIVLSGVVENVWTARPADRLAGYSG